MIRWHRIVVAIDSPRIAATIPRRIAATIPRRIAATIPRRVAATLGRRGTTAVEFAICGLAMAMMVVGSVEFGRLVWTSEVLQEAAVEGARCMGLRAASCAASGAYSSANTTNYVVSVAGARGVTINAGMVTLTNPAVCGGASGFSQVAISYDFTTVAPALLTSLAHGFVVPASACFPNSS